MIKSVIIEDEVNSRELLRKMIMNYCEGLEVIGSAEDVPSGIQLIKEYQPDLVFLDVEMPGGDGFTILKALEEINFKIIFVTGYDQYAIQAIKYAALDYLLKPISLDELTRAIERAKMVINHQVDNIRFLHQQLSNKESSPDKILIPTQTGQLIAHWGDIIKVEANGSYVFFHLSDGNKHLVAYPLNHYEELLPSTLFFRIHKSYIINCQKVKEVEAGRAGKVILEDGSFLKIAARRKKAFLSFYRNKIG